MEQNYQIQENSENSVSHPIYLNTNYLDNYKKNTYYKNFKIYKSFIDECYTKTRLNNHDDLLSFGMALKNIYEIEGFKLFDYFSSKSDSYENKELTYTHYISLPENDKNINLLYDWAIKDNKVNFIKIMKINEIDITETDLAEKIFELAGNKFLYIKIEKIYQLYCFNGKHWEVNDKELKKFISQDLLKYYQELITYVYCNDKAKFNKLNHKINKLKTTNFKNAIIETYIEYNTKDIEFDSQENLFSFNNCVYDLNEGKFKDCSKENYITLTTEYDWREPTDEEIETVNNLIKQIMPNDQERQLYLEILSTTLSNKCLDKFIIFNGNSNSGRELIDNLLLVALGNYGACTDNSILFKQNKLTSIFKKNNLHKKRLIISKETLSGTINISIINLLTNGNYLNMSTSNTTIYECSTQPQFSTELTNINLDKIIYLCFNSSFTDIEENLDEEKHIYPDIKNYKELNFQHKYKYALIKILMEIYKGYLANNRYFQIPLNMKTNTKDILEPNYKLLQWFTENYKFIDTTDNTIFVLVDVMFEKYKFSDYYENLTKYKKSKLDKKSFRQYFFKHIITKNHYKIKHEYMEDDNNTSKSHILLYWQEIN